MSRPIVQTALGDAIIKGIVQFVRADIHTPTSYVRFLSHVNAAPLRQTIAEGIYGARWIYKLGLVLLVSDDELLAHCRAQIMEYAAAAEAIIQNMVSQKVTNMKQWTFKQLINKANSLGIIDSRMRWRLHYLRELRNEIHMGRRKKYRFLRSSKFAYTALCETIHATRKWKREPPVAM